VLGGVAYLLPRNVRGEVTAAIDAPPSTLFFILSSMEQFPRYSPWHQLDPDMKQSFEGPYQGVGSKMSWSSQKSDVGTGSQTVTKAEPYRLVSTRVEFEGQGGLDADFRIGGQGAKSTVTWTFDFDTGMNPLMRYMGLFIRPSVREDYARGLARLKVMAEQLPKTSLNGLKADVVDVPKVTIAAVSQSQPLTMAQIGPALAKHYAQIDAALKAQGLSMAGSPRAAYDPPKDGKFTFVAQVPVPDSFKAAGAVQRIEAYQGRAVKITYKGAYEAMESTYAQGAAFAQAMNLTPNGAPWEDYVDDPAGKKPEDVTTLIYMPVK
jgi:uncharacterized protein YndB with AHSA1/START domain